jgi:hypothetical protein
MVDLIKPGRYGVFVDGEDITVKVKKLRWRIHKNEIPTAEIDFKHFSDMADVLSPGNRVAITYDDRCIGAGILETPETIQKQSGYFSVRLLGADGTALDRSLATLLSYNDIEQDTIIKRIISSDDSGTGNWIIEPGTVDSRGTATVRVENQTRLTPVIKICRDMGLWYEITHPAPALSTVDSYTTTYSTTANLNATCIGVGQSFTCSTETSLDSCQFNIYKTGTLPADTTAVAKLYAHTGTYGSGGLPTGNALAVSDSYDVSGLTGAPQWINFNFSGNQRVTLAASTYYVIVIEYSDGDSSNYIRVCRNASDVHSGNACYEYPASTFTALSGDLQFRVYGSDNVHELDELNAWDWDDATKYPAKHSSVKTFTDANSSRISRKYDFQRATNYVRLLGAVFGTTQLESICYHATDNRSRLKYAMDTWLTADITATQTTIDVTSTAGFPSSGTIEIDNESITYTNKTGTSFTGCTRASANRVSHIEHTGVINMTPAGIYVDDNTNFPASGDVWVGLEKISYTSKTGTDMLSGTITRNVAWNGTALNPGQKGYYPHGKGCFVMDAQYAPTEAGSEAGSSIKTYGFLGTTNVDRTMIDQNSLDIAAGNFIDTYYVPPEIITIDCALPYFEDIWLGDTITVDDEHRTQVQGDYRIFGLELTDSPGTPGKLTITAGNSQYDFSAEYAQTQKELGNISVYAQGVPNMYCITGAENVDGHSTTPANTHPMYMRFFIPPNAISVKDIKLNYRLANFRADSKSVISAPRTKTAVSIFDNPSLASTHFGHNVTQQSVIIALGTSGSATVPASCEILNRYFAVPNTTDNTWFNPQGLIINNWDYMANYTTGTTSEHWHYTTNDFNPKVFKTNSGPYYLPCSTTSFQSIRYPVRATSRTTRTGSLLNTVTTTNIADAQRVTWPSTTMEIQSVSDIITGGDHQFDRVELSILLANRLGSNKSVGLTLSWAATSAGPWTTLQTWSFVLNNNIQTYRWYTDTNPSHESGVYRIQATNMLTNPQDGYESSTGVLTVNTISKHLAPLDYGIYENTSELASPTSCKVNVSVGTGSKEDVIDTYTGNQQNLSITPSTFYWEPNNWYYVKLDTAHADNDSFGGRVRIEADLYPLIYIK